MKAYSTALAYFVCASTLLADDSITYSEHIAPILWENCASCHRPGEVGPFPLLTYEDAVKRANFLVEVTEERRMPPWKAEPGFGEFHDARTLTAEQIEQLARWAEAGAPEGDRSKLPSPPRFPEGWQLGEPDLILEMPEPFEVPASGRDVFRCFVLPIDLPEDRTVAAVEFRPGNRGVVHHALFFLDSTGQARKLEAADPKPGYSSFGGIGITPTGSLGGWAPGATPRRLPEGYGRRLSKGSDLVLQVHYHPIGKPETDRSVVGLYFTERPAEKIIMGLPLVNYKDVYIPAGKSDHEVKASLELPADVTVIGISPHMHYIGREMKVVANLPDGSQEPLIWVQDWDFNWQGQYQYKVPIRLPKGTVLELLATYDNSAANPSNPSDPPKLVTWGEQTTDEMCLCALQVVPDRRLDYLPLFRAAAQALRNERPQPGGGRFRRLFQR